MYLFDLVLGNVEGKFVWGKRDFSNAAQNIRCVLNPPRLTLEAELLAADRKTYRLARFEPSSVGSKGADSKAAVTRVQGILRKAQEEGKQVEISHHKAPDGTQIFCFSAGVKGHNVDDDCAVKVTEPELSAAVARCADETGHRKCLPLPTILIRYFQLTCL